MLVELPFAGFFLSKLLGTSADVDIHHLASLDPEVYKNLLFLKSYEGDVEELGLNFTVVNNDLGEAQVRAVPDAAARAATGPDGRFPAARQWCSAFQAWRLRRGRGGRATAWSSVTPALWDPLPGAAARLALGPGDWG